MRVWVLFSIKLCTLGVYLAGSMMLLWAIISHMGTVLAPWTHRQNQALVAGICLCILGVLMLIFRWSKLLDVLGVK